MRRKIHRLIASSWYRLIFIVGVNPEIARLLKNNNHTIRYNAVGDIPKNWGFLAGSGRYLFWLLTDS